MSDAVGTSINNTQFLAIDSTKILNNAQEQEANDLSEFLKLEYKKYFRYKIIYDTLEDVIGEDSNVDKNLKRKIKDILLGESLAQSIKSDDNALDNRSATLLGACCLSSSELNYSERNELEEELKLKLDEKHKCVMNEYYKLTNSKHFNESLKNNFKSLAHIQMSEEDKVLIDYKRKLICIQEQYVQNLLILQDLLMEITNLRLKKLPETTDQKVKECQSLEKLNHLKSVFTQQKIRADVFMETSTSLKAYSELIKDIKEQQRECQTEIQDLIELKGKYDQVACKQFDDILKSYLQYKSSIEKKKILYDCLKI